MSEKTGKRLVSKKEYVRIVLKAGYLPMLLLGEAWFCVSLFRDEITGYRLHPSSWNGYILPCGFLIILLGAFWCAFKKARADVASTISSVTPITRHNTGDLPAVETLVRPSDLPASHQQIELLRAAKPAQETPAEELLRASVTGGQTDRRGEAEHSPERSLP